VRTCSQARAGRRYASQGPASDKFAHYRETARLAEGHRARLNEMPTALSRKWPPTSVDRLLHRLRAHDEGLCLPWRYAQRLIEPTSYIVYAVFTKLRSGRA
jgi:hypothetical protein